MYVKRRKKQGLGFAPCFRFDLEQKAAVKHVKSTSYLTQGPKTTIRGVY